MAQLLTLRAEGVRSHDLRHPNDLRHAAWRPDGAAIMLAGNQGTVGIWDGNEAAWLPGGGFENLRGCAWSPDCTQATIVGNGGALLRFRDGRLFREAFYSPVSLRRVAWSPTGDVALIAGNDGLLLEIERTGVPRRAGFADSHLRAIEWLPAGDRALICANGGLYVYDRGKEGLARVHREERGDLIAACIDPDGRTFWACGFRSGAGHVEQRFGVLYRGTFDSWKLELATEPARDVVWTGVARLAESGGVILVGDPGDTGAGATLARPGASGRTEEIADLRSFHPAGVIARPPIPGKIPAALRAVQAVIFGSARSRFYRA
ncbi:MAG: WD40 repeat domain-containing protein [Chloroflexi bacterium]|nr:WD40 repeat domain-containing protein [Chloroflexota bacterium]